MGKSLVTALLKRHVNIYSDLYTLCFLHSYVQSPESRAQPQDHITAPHLCLTIFWYQVFGQQSKLVLELRSHWYHPSEAEAVFSKGLNRNKPHCFSSPTAAATRTQEANGSTRTLERALARSPVILLPRPPRSTRQQEGSWSNTREGGSGYQQVPASWLPSHTAG